MKFAVMGAGAVGCYFGGLLARAGYPVTLIARPEHVRAIEQDGLRVQTLSFDERVKLAASTETSAAAGADVVLLCVKSTATEEACAALRPHLAPGTLVLTLQNGVDNAQRAQAALGNEVDVAAAVVYVATEMAGPGHVQHHGRGELLLAPCSRATELVEAFARAGARVEVSDNVRGALWAKLVLNCVYNALSAITGKPYGTLTAAEGMDQVMQGLMDECLAVAHAEGVRLPAHLAQAVRDIVRTMPTQRSSTAQDLARGRKTEIDHLNGLVVRRGAALGVPTPLNQAMWAMVKLLESPSGG